MFSPFNKALNEVSEKDLEVLKGINEGWYIEYKSQIPTPQKIAKSISSFANSYGGLYFIGVTANASNLATDFPGVDVNMNIFHDAVRGNCDPFPYFDCYPISLSNGKYIIMISIKQGQNAPYIHSDGRIYRRQESSSDPIYEINKQLIDQLYERRQKVKQQKQSFRNIDYGFCNAEDNFSYLYGFITTEDPNENLISDFYDPEFQTTVIQFFNDSFSFTTEKTIEIKGNFSFNNATLFSDSIILRNLSNRNLAYNSLTIELFRNGCIKFIIPIAKTCKPQLSVYNDLLTYCSENSIDIASSYVEWIEIRNILQPIMGCIAKYEQWLVKYDYSRNIEISFRGENFFRTCLISNNSDYIEFIKKYSLPIIIKSSYDYPEKPLLLNWNIEKEDLGEALLIIVSFALSGFGIPGPIAMQLFADEQTKKS